MLRKPWVEVHVLFVPIFVSTSLSPVFQWASQVALVIKNPPANAGDCKRSGLNSWVRKIFWRRAWKPTPVFLPEESHGRKSLVGYGPWGHKDSDATEHARMHIQPQASLVVWALASDCSVCFLSLPLKVTSFT